MVGRSQPDDPAQDLAGASPVVREVVAGEARAAGRAWFGWVSLFALLAFVLDTYLVLSGARLQGFDIPVAVAVQSTSLGPVAEVMKLTNASGGWGQVLLGAGAVIGLFVYERRAGVLMALGSLGSAMDGILKVSIARHRPSADLVHVLDTSAGYSYPSGHAVFYTWLAFMLAAALTPRVRPLWLVFLWTAAALLIVVACLGRVWAGAHWPSDVIGGFLLGLAWSAFVLWISARWLPDPRFLN
jgi:undecaprenyl-diphosphatase